MELVLPKEAKKIIEKSKYQQELEQVVLFTFSLIERNNLKPTSVQKNVLINHLSEMVDRAEEKRYLDEVDPAIFNKVSKSSLQMAQKIIDYVEKKVGKLAKSEKFVLSIHFETMKLN